MQMKGAHMETLNLYSKKHTIPGNKFKRIFEILEYSFPPCERGNYALHRAEFNRDDFRCLCYEPAGIPSAFINYYIIAELDALFIEHFACATELRGKGIGSSLMKELLGQAGSSLILLEVEPPDNEISCRRVKFYQRLGFTLNEGSYFQPAFYGNPEPLPLKLMSNRPLSDHDFTHAVSAIHQKVYKVLK